ncbi:MAG: hypothetical protein KGR26_01940 [Cyanobacteria bacterium REEB65]|nr:hypothetical protein [Cyanobacteria bacterium REEB65]
MSAGWRATRLIALLLALWFGALTCHAEVDDIAASFASSAAMAASFGALQQLGPHELGQTRLAAAQNAQHSPCPICEWLSATPGVAGAPAAIALGTVADRPVDLASPGVPPAAPAVHYHTRAPPSASC